MAKELTLLVVATHGERGGELIAYCLEME
jgi:hypothetical protein